MGIFGKKPKVEIVVENETKQYIVILSKSFVGSEQISTYLVETDSFDKVDLFARRTLDKMSDGFSHVKHVIIRVDELKKIEL